MNGYVIIEDKRFWIGEGLVSVSVTEDYGFVATQVQMTFDYRTLLERIPDVLRRKPHERVPVFAAVILDDDEVVEYAGFLEDNSGENTVMGADPETVQIASRSILALLLDEEEGGKNRITAHYVDKDWGHVVREAVKPYGFKTGLVQSGGPAGERRPDKSYFLSIDNQLPGEVITSAVSGTGFVANTDQKANFIFAPSMVPPEQLPIQFEFKKHYPESTMQSYRFGNNGINQFTSRQLVKVIPGSLLRLLVYTGFRDNDRFLSGNYYGTQIVYRTSQVEADRNLEVVTVRELPVLGAAG